ncbi:MAG: glycosyltransferase family 2 protein [Bacteroidota bacterium]
MAGVRRSGRVVVSIILVNHNTREILRKCLSSIGKQAKGIAYEIILVDNNSTDGSAEMVQREFPAVRLIRNSENRGFAAANNQGISRACGDYTLLLNSDTEVLDGAIQRTVEFMERHPKASIVGCRLLNRDGTLQPSCRSFPSVLNLFTESFFLYLIFKRSKFFGKYYMSFFNHGSIREVDVVKGAYMMIRKEVFDRVGLFDESYFMYAEEMDFCYRAKKSGHKVFFYPGSQVIHLGGGSIADPQSYTRQLYDSQILFFRKHFTGIRRNAVILIKQAGIALRIVVYFLGAAVTLRPDLIRKSRAYSRLLFR